MDLTKVFLIHLRRPKGKKKDPNERRDDPFYEFGSFGCTGCHSATLFSRKHATDLEGSRLGFFQGGALGHRLVFLTPPVAVKVWLGHCEALWAPGAMPFKYNEAPVLVRNGGRSDFPLVEALALGTKRTTVEGGLTSRLRSSAQPLAEDMAREVIDVYERLRVAASPAVFARTYDEALPWSPPVVDGDRRGTYERLLRGLRNNVTATALDGASLVAIAQPRCGRSRREKPREREHVSACQKS